MDDPGIEESMRSCEIPIPIPILTRKYSLAGANDYLTCDEGDTSLQPLTLTFVL